MNNLNGLTYVAVLLGYGVPQNLFKRRTLQWINLRGWRGREGRWEGTEGGEICNERGEGGREGGDEREGRGKEREGEREDSIPCSTQ